MKEILLWDLPTRLFHWLLVLCVFSAIASGIVGGQWMALHVQAGLAVIFLIAFRLVWGVFGSTYARFCQFFPTPGRVLAYLKGQWQGEGHNPLGAFSVFALLFLCIFQAVSGLFTTDEITLKGPLYNLIDKDTSLFITSIHKQMAWVLMVFIGLHLLAIVFYKIVKKDNLVIPMITGKKQSAHGQSYKPAALWALILALLVAAIALYLAYGAWIPTPPPAAPLPPAPAW